MLKQLNLSSFWQTYIAVLLSFVASRLMLQTDLLMIAPLSQFAVAAFAVPNHIMIIDMVVAMALGPVVSVLVSQENQLSKKSALIKMCMGFTLAVSILLTIIGLLIYPLIVDYIVSDPSVRVLAQVAIFWMTISIPIRMVMFISNMCLFACSKNKEVIVINGIAMIANGVLDYLFIYVFHYHFSGVYIATFIVSLLGALCLLKRLHHHIGTLPIGFFKIQWIKKLVGMVGPEWWRLFSWQMEGFIVLAVLASQLNWLGILSVFSVTQPFLLLVMMPLIALMRTSAMKIAAIGSKDSVMVGWNLLQLILTKVFMAAIFMGLVIMVIAYPVGIYGYHLDQYQLNWWLVFCGVVGITLPIFVYGSLLRSCYQACHQFNTIARLEIITTWLLFMPLLWFGLQQASPFLFFGAFAVREAVIAIFLRYALER